MAEVKSISDVKVGMRLEAMDKYGKWYMARIVEVDEDEGDVLVHFEGWSSRYDEYVEVDSNRLRILTAEALQRVDQLARAKKNLQVGDRVQAKWQDGRMYFGKILKVHREDVDVLFDDGVKYTTPISQVRRRRVEDKPHEETPQELAARAEARKRRALKRNRNEDSGSQISQTSLSSPPSSPIFVPKRSRPSSARFLDEDSTETESDFDDSRVRIRERPTSARLRTRSREGKERVSSKSESKASSPGSSDSERSKSSDAHKKKYEALRDPYKLRSVPQQLRLSPVTEHLPKPESSSLAGAEGNTGSLGSSPTRARSSKSHSGSGSGSGATTTTLTSTDGSEVASQPGSRRKQKTIADASRASGPPRTPKSTQSSSSGGHGSPSSHARKQPAPPTTSGAPSAIVGSLNLVAAAIPLQFTTAAGSVAMTTIIPVVTQAVSTSASTTFSTKTSSMATSSTATAALAKTQQKDSQEAVSSKRSLSDSAVPAGGSGVKGQSVGSPSKKRTPSYSISTRARAQTMFENMTKKSDKKTVKLAPKELVITWDHNDYKCKFTGCTKSFRKESLLISHVRHYHHIKPKAAAGKQKGMAGPLKDKEKSGAVKSPKSPRLAKSPQSCSRSRSRSRSSTPKSPKLKSILSPPKPKQPDDLEHCMEHFRRSKSPTESFFETMEKQRRSSEMMKLLEQSTQQQMAAVAQSRAGGSSSFSSKAKTTPKSKHISATARLHVQGVRPPLRPTPALPVQQQKATTGSSTGSSSSTSSKGKSAHSSVSKSTSKKPKAESHHKPSETTAVKTPAAELKALQKESLSTPPVVKKPPVSSSADSQPVKPTEGGSSTMPTASYDRTSMESVGELDVGKEEGVPIYRWTELGSPSDSEPENPDDVVHCVCGSTVDEGFMIQCEQCLCWQHGDCIGITNDTQPQKYLCYICINPPGLRPASKYRFDRDWFSEGKLPSFPGGPKFTQNAAVCKSHELADAVYKLKKIALSLKVKLQAASTPNHPYLKQWAKECSHLARDDLMSYLLATLQPVSYDSQSSRRESPAADNHDPSTTPPKMPEEREELEDATNKLDLHVDDKSGEEKEERANQESVRRPKSSAGNSIDTTRTSDIGIKPSSEIGSGDNSANETTAIARLQKPEPEIPLQGTDAYKEVEVKVTVVQSQTYATGHSAEPADHDWNGGDQAKSKQHSPPVNVATLSLDPLPPSIDSSPVTTPPSSSVNPPSTDDTPDPSSLQLAPLPPLKTEDVRQPTSTSKPVSQDAAQSSGETLDPSSQSLTSSISNAETSSPVETNKRSAVEKSTSFDSVVSDIEFTEGFGIQETSVFAVDVQSGDREAPRVEFMHPKSIPSGLESNQGAGGTGTASGVPAPLPNPSKLNSGPHSAFKPVAIPTTIGQLATLLTGQVSLMQPSTLSSSGFSNSRESLPSTSDRATAPVKSNISTALGSCGLRPKVESNPVFSETVSSLSALTKQSMDTIPLEEFADAFLQADGSSWCQRMLLLDHVEAVQDKMAAWMTVMEKQIEELPGEEGRLENMESLLQEVHSTVKQLGRIQQTISMES